MNDNFTNILRDRAADDRTGIYLVENGHDIFVSYQQLHYDAVRIAAILSGAGVSPGDRVLFQLAGNHDLINCFWGCIYAGAVPAMAPNVSGVADVERVEHLARILPEARILVDDRSGRLLAPLLSRQENKGRALSLALVADPEGGGEELSGYPVRRCGSDEVLIQFSSGSTGTPKGVIVTGDTALQSLGATVPRHPHRFVNRMLTWLPLTHNLSLIGYHVYAMYMNYDQILLPVSEVILDPFRWFDAVTRYQPTVTICPNFGFRHVLRYLDRHPLPPNHGYDFSNIQKLMTGSEPIDAPLARSFSAAMEQVKMRDNVITAAYGMSEACLMVSVTDIYSGLTSVTLDRSQISIGKSFSDICSAEGAEFVSVGHPVPGIDLTIRGDHGENLGEEVVGEVHISGAPVTSSALTERGLVKHVRTKDGALSTGDIGVIHDGQLYIIGRRKDIIFVNGRNYFSPDLEAVLENELGISSVVLGRSNPDTGEEDIVVFPVRGGGGGRANDSFAGRHSDEGHVDGDDVVERTISTVLMRDTGVQVSKFVWIDELPTASNGKKLRRQLERLL